MFVALEINSKAINNKNRKLWNKQGLWIDPHVNLDKKYSQHTVRRLMGSSAEDSVLIREMLEANYDPKTSQAQWRTEQVRNLTLFRLSHYSNFGLSPLNSVLVVKLVFSEDQLSEISKFKRLKSKTYSEILKPLNLSDSIDKSSAVHPVIGTLAPVGHLWQENVIDGWMHIHGSYIEEKVLEATVSRVAIERSLLNWAVLPRQGLMKIFRPALVGYRLRLWRVEFLSDWETITRGYHSLRESLNLPRVREEQLSISKSWWATVVSISTVAAFIAALLALTQI